MDLVGLGTSVWLSNSKTKYCSCRKYLDKPFFEYFLMILISIMVSGFNILRMWLITEFLNIYYVQSNIIISLITFFIKFILSENILFSLKL